MCTWGTTLIRVLLLDAKGVLIMDTVTLRRANHFLGWRGDFILRT